MLHISNGDAATARIAAAGITGELLPWRDVLHEGPVPADLPDAELREIRARFITAQGWADLATARADLARRDAALACWTRHEEVVLWFEHDLYDQLQLLQLLDWFARVELGDTRLSLICVAEYLGPAAPERLRALFAGRRAVTAAELALGRAAWAAFRAPEPQAIERLLATDTSALPFLADALRRHLAEFPAVGSGLSRSERQALAAIAAGQRTPHAAYLAAHQQQEDPIFLGDTVFASYLQRLIRSPTPLVLRADGRPLAALSPDDVWSGELRITEAGQAVLAGQQDWVALAGIDRWLGGVHLHGRVARWRWNETTQQLEPGRA